MRKQRPRGATSRDDVVKAALDVVDRGGLDALTIRAVASALGSPPMSLYAHFTSKEELLDLMYVAVAAHIYAETGEPTWQDELAALSEQVHRVLRQHPNWIPLLSRPAPPMTLTVRERLIRLMTEDGISPEDALQAIYSATLVSIGMVLVELTFRDAQGHSALQTRFDKLRGWFETTNDPGHTLARAAFTKTHRLDLGANHAFTVRALVEGLTALAAR